MIQLDLSSRFQVYTSKDRIYYTIQVCVRAKVGGSFFSGLFKSLIQESKKERERDLEGSQVCI